MNVRIPHWPFCFDHSINQHSWLIEILFPSLVGISPCISYSPPSFRHHSGNMEINCKHAWAGGILHTICRLITSVVEFQDLLQWFGDAFSGHKREIPCKIRKTSGNPKGEPWILLFIQRSTPHEQRYYLFRRIQSFEIVRNKKLTILKSFHFHIGDKINLRFLLSWKLNIAWNLTILDFE